MFDSFFSTFRRAGGALTSLSPAIDLVLRFWVASVFFKSGLTKIGNWDATLFLFENEYHVPLLPTDLAAWLGTATELAVPVFLVLGLGTRFFALVLFAFNIVAVASYPALSESGLRDHVYWGLMLLVTLVHGPGKLSVDHLLDVFLLRNRQDSGRPGVPTWAH